MKTVYIDSSDYTCHIEQNADTSRISYDTAYFDGKCNAFIEGYRIIPKNYTWTRSDGKVFAGEMIAPWKPYAELAAAQTQYEADLVEVTAAYKEGVDSVWT